MKTYSSTSGIGVHCGRMWAPKGLGSLDPMIFPVAAHMDTVSSWVCLLPTASLGKCSVFPHLSPPGSALTSLTYSRYHPVKVNF